MQISSSSAGLYPVLVPNVRKPAIASVATNAVPTTTSSTEQTTHQRVAETKSELFPVVDGVRARQQDEGLSVGGLTRQLSNTFNRSSVETSENTSLQSSGQRAVAAYADVATQEHRDELVELLGIDLFA